MTCWSCIHFEVLYDNSFDCALLLDMPVSAEDCPSFCYEPGSDEEESE